LWTAVELTFIEALRGRICTAHNNVRVIKSRIMRLAGYVARMGERRGVFRVLVMKPEGKSPLVRPRLRRENNIKMDLQEVGLDRTKLAQDRDKWRAQYFSINKNQEE
jgi:hypothetical protein